MRRRGKVISLMAKKAKKTKKKAKAKTARTVARRSARLDKQIGKRVRLERTRRKLTLRQVADRAGMSNSQLSQVELGKNAASVWALVRIAKAMKIRPAKLLSDL